MSKKEINPGVNNSEDIFRKMVEEIQDYAIILLDPEGIIRNWNAGAEKIKQYSKEEIIGRHFSIFYLPADVEQNLPQRLINEASATGRAVQEGWRKRKDGSVFWASVTITAIHDNDQNVIGYSKVTRDLSEKRKADESLRISEERYHQMIAEVDDYAIILLSERGTVENWNLGAEKIKGYTSKEIVGKHFEIFYTPEDRASGLPHSLLKQAEENGKASHEGWRVRKDGTKFWGTIVITALHGRKGDIIGFSKVTRDLTQRKLADEKLAAYTRELEIQNSELEQFAYVASHDLQEPLRKIQTFTELIQNNYQDEAFSRRYLDKLNTSAKRLADLVRSLLNYSRLSKDSSEFGDVDLNQVMQGTIADFELLIHEKNAKLIYDTLPVVSGNQMQLGQLFANLIGNSLKFSPQDNPVVKVSHKMIERTKIVNPPDHAIADNYLKIMFADNGIGFEQQYDKVIFSLFQRLHGKQDYAGTGIGLALCKKIVENHGGFITAESQPGKGATFNVYLPFDKS